MVSRNGRINAARDIKHRAAAPPESFTRCAAFGCKRPTQRSARRGLSEVLCKHHAEHLRRHGHETRRSYRTDELKPYRQAAREWLRLRENDADVRGTITRLDVLMSSQFRAKDAYHHRSMVPKAKAGNVLAKLHTAGKSGSQLLEIVLTILAAHSELGPWGAPDWKHVQIAKLAKRLRGASGTHTPGLPARYAHRYPRAEGIYMRILGRMIAEKAAHAIDGETIEEVKALRRKH